MSAKERVLSVKPEELHPDPEQPRSVFDQESLEALAKSLLSGQVQPILAYNKDGKLTILDGARRALAARIAKLPTVDVLLVDEPTERHAILLQQLLTNLQREGLSAIDQARGFERVMRENGWTAGKVAAALGLSPGYVSKTLALLTLPNSVQEQVASGTLPATTAYEITRAPDQEAQERLAAEALEHKLTRDQVTRRLAKPAASSQAPTGRRGARVTAPLGGGRQVSVRGPGPLAMDSFIEALEDLLVQARKFRNRGKDLRHFLAQLKLNAADTSAKASPSSEPLDGAA